MKKRTIEDMHKLAVMREGLCLSEIYINSCTKLKWQCSLGHTWETTPNNAQQGKWCPKCAGNECDTIEAMSNLAKSRGGKCLSKIYINRWVKLMWKCSCGSIWSATPHNVKSGTWCPVCGVEKRAETRRGSIEDMQELAKLKGGRCLSNTYTNAHLKLKWGCSCGFIWEATPGSVKQGSWCPKCAGKNHTLEEAENRAEVREGVCLSTEWKGVTVLMKWQCSNKHIWEANFHNIQQGRWCSICSSGRSERQCRSIFEQLFGVNFSKVSRVVGMLSSKGYPMELDGYNSILGIAFEYQGKQHYKYVPFFHKDENDFRRKQKDDKLKLKYCKENNIILIEVPYWLDFENLKEFIRTELLKKSYVLPENFENIELDLFKGFTPDDSLKELQDIAEKHNGKCLSKVYINSTTKLKWQCSCGNKWYAIPYSIKKGRWCPKCGIKNSTDKQRSSIKDIQKMMESRGGILLSTKYINASSKVVIQCGKGHIWEAVANSVQQGSWCPYCTKYGPKLFSSTQIKKILKLRFQDHLSVRRIGEELGCSRTPINRILKEYLK